MDLLFEEDGFFTRDDLTEYIEIPLEDLLREGFNIPYESLGIRSYIEDDNRLEVDFRIYDNEFTLTANIDFRRIKAPGDLQKYAYEIYRDLVNNHFDMLMLEY